MKIFFIKKSQEFKQISQKNIKYIAKSIIVISAPTPDFYLLNQKSPRAKIDQFCRFGVVASKKVGNAVVRNKIKRRLKAAISDLSKSSQELNLVNNYDYVIIAKKEIVNFNYKDVLTDLKFCLKGIMRKSVSS